MHKQWASLPHLAIYVIKTAPSPTGLASHETINGSFGLQYVKKRLEINSCFSD